VPLGEPAPRAPRPPPERRQPPPEHSPRGAEHARRQRVEHSGRGPHWERAPRPRLAALQGWVRRREPGAPRARVRREGLVRQEPRGLRRAQALQGQPEVRQAPSDTPPARCCAAWVRNPQSGATRARGQALARSRVEPGMFSRAAPVTSCDNPDAQPCTKARVDTTRARSTERVGRRAIGRVWLTGGSPKRAGNWLRRRAAW
jgi:hypothetical protein